MPHEMKLVAADPDLVAMRLTGISHTVRHSEMLAELLWTRILQMVF